MHILVTGGTGYIGSHTIVELLDNGHDVTVVDNLCNSKEEVLWRLWKITRRKVHFYPVDLMNKEALDSIFANNNFDAVMHFAGLKAVGESVQKPLEYYQNNLIGTLVLLDLMKKYKVRTLVFSSSATVYGFQKYVPIKEDAELSATNPYGQTKLIIEQMLRDLVKAESDWNIAILRYFNPVGAHSSGHIGEDTNSVPNNLLPFISQVAAGKLPKLYIYGNDYQTQDGTGIRDYIHVMDLAKGHIAALNYLRKKSSLIAINLGTGRGYSVLEIIKAFEKSSGKKIPYEIVARRPGDTAECYADPTLAFTLLGWKAQYDIDKMCTDQWNWQLQIIQ